MKLAVLAVSTLLFYIGLPHVASLAVMSVDLGSEWMKVGIVSPGVPMEIALNVESKRKSPAVISFRDNTRLFGEDAAAVGVKYPNKSFAYLLDLLGKSIDHPLVKLYQKRFPYYEIVPDKERDTIRFKLDEDTYFSPEELVAQILVKAKQFAEHGAQQPIKECVLTVPGYFNQIERKALLQAGELAGLKVLQLINDYTAVALNYGIFRSKTFNETTQYVMFYDMGAYSTSAVLIGYQTVKTKERGYPETHPQATVLGVGFDRTLGGLEIQLRLRDYLGKKFNEMKKTKTDVFTSPRAMAKLFKEAGRLKNVLSANAEHIAQVEGLLDDKDFKLLVKREEMEEMCKDLFERVKGPVQTALKTAHLTMDIVSQVVLVGAGTRVPKVQEVLQKYVKQDLAKNLNTDEAATMGAVYRAAELSTGFKVAKFITKDAVIYPVQVTFERPTEEGSVKQVKRTLFSLMNPYPSKKIITFNKYTSDFNFNVNYAELDYLPPNEVRYLGSARLSEFQLSGVSEALNKNSGKNAEPKGIKAHFQMNESGLLNLLNVELIVEKTILPEDETGTLSKIGSTFSKLFGGEEKPVEEKPTPETAEEKPVEEKAQEQPAEEKEDKPKQDQVKNETQKNETETAKETKPKVGTFKEPIKSTEHILTILPLDKKQMAEASEKIEKLNKLEADIKRRETAMNTLESFVIDIQNKLDEEDYKIAAKPEEVSKIKEACTEVANWLYEDGVDADTETYEKKLDELHALTRDLFSRVWEHRERPEAIKSLDTMLNHSSHFLNNAKNLTKKFNPQKDVFTEVEIETLHSLIVDTKQWKDKAANEQEKLGKSEPIKLTVKMVMDKIAALDREMKYLVNKLKFWKPRKVEKPVTEKPENGSDSSKKNESETTDSKDEVVIDVGGKGDSTLIF
ncbi:unnamed protein product [Acanthoscelides obtectus]|uniref:Hypoxia up-regulated protein 1 n=1 Tax=Acanthoscelides obtectus TaxID=200917 RepID=A0A9P0K7P9_ACAOB|nr:unnamed protein product [Acanthoscelides obtectus]CAK1676709.1 Hypoxia up-regulated protein 1 [Acanthoscelides obtectus]